MFRKLLKSKIHRATVTQADVDYEGSITLPPPLMELADIIEYESVHVWNVSAGTRFETYAIAGEPEGNGICVNGAAARLVTPGDLIIVASFTFLKEDERGGFAPKLVFVDSHNRFVELRREVPGPLRRVTPPL
ncbi:MAG: aspartate 1-decarboxylase [Bdellovibrionota bacterium]